MSSPLPDPEALLQHREFLRALARQLLGDEHLAEDVVQESYIAALANPPRDAQSLRSWLAQVVARRASNHRRAAARRRLREQEAAPDEQVPSAAEVSESLHVQRRVLAALDGLHEPYKTTLYLRWYEGLPPREIARRMNVPVETVRSRSQRGLARLRGELDTEFGERERWATVLLPLTRIDRAARWPALAAGAIAAAGLVAAGAWTWNLWPRAVVPGALRPAQTIREVHEQTARENGAFAGEQRVLEPAAAQTASARGSFPTDSGEPLAAPPLAPPGPSYELDLTLPPGVRASDLMAELLVLEEATWTPGRRRTDRLGVAQVQPGRPALVTFPKLPALGLTKSGGVNVRALRLWTRDGRFGALARVHALRGRYPVPVVLELAPRSHVRLSLRDERGAPVRGARVSATPHAGRSLTFTSSSDREGFVQLNALAAGTWNLVVRSQAHGTNTSPVRVELGAPNQFEVLLATLPVQRVRGQIWSRAGDEQTPPPMRLHDPREPLRRYSVQPVPIPGQDAAWSFDFGEVPAGEYVLLPPAASPYAWDPPLREVNGTERSANFQRLDGEPLRAIHVRAVDAATGERMEQVRATLLVDRYGTGTRRAAQLEDDLEPQVTRYDETPWPSLAAELPLHWLIECEGYLAAQGDQDALHQENGEWILDVRLAPAWRATFWIGTRNAQGKREALEGARLVTHAGRELGHSLADGLLHLELSYDPGRLQLQADGWRVREWTGFRRGKPVEVRELYEIWLEREP